MTWTDTPTRWSNGFFDHLFGHEWELEKSPAGAWQWVAQDAEATVPGPEQGDPARRPTMLTTDLSLRMDPAYEQISRRFHAHPDEFADAFARAWFKLTHRDMGPIQRYLGPLVPQEELLWQDRVPAVDHELVGDAEVADLKQRILASGLTVGQLVSTAWGAGGVVPRQRQARRRQRRPDPARAAVGLGGPTSPTSSPRWSAPSRGSRRSSTQGSRAASGSRSPTWSCWAAARRSRRPPGTPGTT